LVAGYAISSLGVQSAYRILASSTLVVNLASSLLLKDRAGRRVPQQKIFSYRDLGQIEILLVVFWGTVTELGYITLLYSLPNYASSVGLNPTQGSIAGALLNLGQGFGRPIVGYCSDAFGRINMAMCMTTFCAVLCFSLWIPATTYGSILAFALLAGTACGTFWGTIAPVLADVTGLKNFASTFGMICFSLVLPATFAEPIAIQLVEAPTIGSEQYLSAQIYTGFMFLAGGVSLWILRSWKINEVDEKARSEQLLEHDSGRDSAFQPVIKPSWAFLKKILVLRNV
jgi:MFS family permease